MQPRTIVAAPGTDSQEVFWAWVDRACQHTARELIEWMLGQLQQQAVGAAWHERTPARAGYRNGVYRRTLVSPYGPLPIDVPRLRGVRLDCQLVFDRYRRRCRDVDRVLQRAFLMGVSLRDAAELGEQLWGQGLSHQTVGALMRWLDGHLAAYRRTPLEPAYPVVQIDGMYVTVEGVTRVVMLVMGLKDDGTKRVLGFSVERGEGCRDLLWDLRRRGLEGVALFVTDDSGAIRSALEEVYPEVPHQVCTWHRLVGLWERLGPVPWRPSVVREAGRPDLPVRQSGGGPGGGRTLDPPLGRPSRGDRGLVPRGPGRLAGVLSPAGTLVAEDAYHQPDGAIDPETEASAATHGGLCQHPRRRTRRLRSTPPMAPPARNYTQSLTVPIGSDRFDFA
ncbi:MAG: transposase [Planctomycetes bacterium]|nr:transposase [Planctomycetota bacterium]